jgi:crotonobetainyl-CoA:carnitine CoA-transferase CaiB-like acyl-CoA transferase
LIEVDRLHAVLACRSEWYLAADEPLPVLDGATGDLPCADGWIRIHTLYPHHRAAARRALGDTRGREQFVAAVAERTGEDIQEAVVAAGGAAARLATAEEWAAHPHGRTRGELPPVVVTRTGDGPSGDDRFRVLDLTRVIAGPTASKILALHGAEVLRIEPAGFPEVPTLTVDTGFGKRSATLDLRTAEDRAVFEGLVAEADVIVHGYRPGAMAALGYGDDALVALRPGLVVATLSAWGAGGPWEHRRGFDSLVQMASGIAAEGMAAYSAERPVPLPMQLLDHATAYLLALGILSALRRRRDEGGAWHVEVALASTAAWLSALGRSEGLHVPEPELATVDGYVGSMPSPWGRLRFIRPAGTVDGRPLRWTKAPEPAGASAPAWEDRAR